MVGSSFLPYRFLPKLQNSSFGNKYRFRFFNFWQQRFEFVAHPLVESAVGQNVVGAEAGTFPEGATVSPADSA